MKLIGIQLENYACFEKCFVPLEPGLSVLVGRNNSGKTAILRGLTCLRSLPIGEQKQFEPEVHDYSWTSRVHRDFKIQVLFEAEPTDTYLLHECPMHIPKSGCKGTVQRLSFTSRHGPTTDWFRWNTAPFDARSGKSP